MCEVVQKPRSSSSGTWAAKADNRLPIVDDDTAPVSGVGREGKSARIQALYIFPSTKDTF
jgi:hypothetical protein